MAQVKAAADAKQAVEEQLVKDEDNLAKINEKVEAICVSSSPYLIPLTPFTPLSAPSRHLSLPLTPSLPSTPFIFLFFSSNIRTQLALTV